MEPIGIVMEWVKTADLSHNEDVEDKDDDERNDGVDECVNPRPDVLNHNVITHSSHSWIIRRQHRVCRKLWSQVRYDYDTTTSRLQHEATTMLRQRIDMLIFKRLTLR